MVNGKFVRPAIPCRVCFWPATRERLPTPGVQHASCVISSPVNDDSPLQLPSVHRCRSKQIFWGAKDFCPKSCAIFAQKVVQFLSTVFWCDHEKMVFTYFSAHVGRHFCPDFQGFCQNFQGFCPDFQQIKTFGGALAHPPPTPLLLFIIIPPVTDVHMMPQRGKIARKEGLVN